jgi:hypothetical protein
MGRPYKCPYCGQSDTVSKGVRRTKTLGERRIRRCKACNRKFTPKGQKPGDLPDAAVARGIDNPAGAQLGIAQDTASTPTPVAAQVPAPEPQAVSPEGDKSNGPPI